MAGSNGLSTTIAGAAISLALIDALIDNGMLTKETAKGILTTAQDRLRPFTANPDAQEAMRIISAMYQKVGS